MTEEAQEAVIRRLRGVANARRRAEPTVADDIESAIRYSLASPEEREILGAKPQFGSLISRLEKRANKATEENESPFANDLLAAVELIRGL